MDSFFFRHGATNNGRTVPRHCMMILLWCCLKHTIFLAHIANIFSSRLSVNTLKENHQNHWKIPSFFAVRIWLQHIATVQAVVLHNQLSNRSHKIIKFLGNYHVFLQLEYGCSIFERCTQNHRFKTSWLTMQTFFSKTKRQYLERKSPKSSENTK